MADRMDSVHNAPVNGLSIWVGLASFFSDASERTRAHDALTTAKAQRKQRKHVQGAEGEKPEEGMKHVMGEEKRRVKAAVGRMSEALGLKKKSADTAKAEDATLS